MQPTQHTPFADCPAEIGVAFASAAQASTGAAELLRQALAAAGAAPATRREPILRERDRAPRLAHSGDWRLSLSHSGNELAAAATCNYAVGIDLECHRNRNFARLSRLLGWNAKAAEAFYPRWTLAEALFKAGAASGISCFDAADRALRDHASDLPMALELTLTGRTWHARWLHEAVNQARPAASTCIVWSDLA